MNLDGISEGYHWSQSRWVAKSKTDFRWNCMIRAVNHTCPLGKWWDPCGTMPLFGIMAGIQGAIVCIPRGVGEGMPRHKFVCCHVRCRNFAVTLAKRRIAHTTHGVSPRVNCDGGCRVDGNPTLRFLCPRTLGRFSLLHSPNGRSGFSAGI